MRKLIAKGIYCKYKNAEGQPNRPIEEKRNIVEDASWSYRGIPGVFLDTLEINPVGTFNLQTKDILQEHKDRGYSTITRNDVINKQMGTHTNDIVKEYIYGETHRGIDSVLHRSGTPKSLMRKVDHAVGGDRRIPMGEMHDYQLIEIAFFTLTYPTKVFSRYGDKIRKHFKMNTGEDCKHTINSIIDKESNLSNLLNAIKDRIARHYKSYGNFTTTIDITDQIAANMLDFSKSFGDLSEMMAIGGVQQIEIEGFLTSNKKMQGSDSGPVENIRDFKDLGTHLKVELQFTIKDWFGVDEEDVYKDAKAANLDRVGLAALWVLQHQRGYRPFINVFSYKKEILVVVK